MRAVFLYIILISVVQMQAQYISKVFEYKPAPGQHINTTWGSPGSVESIVGGLNGTLSLGAFGGYVVFSFDQPVANDPANPFGIDFTLFGNPLPNWAEHGIVSVMKDENGNGLPDDPWYELAGSDYFFSSTIQKYEVTYQNPGNTSAADVPWIDNLADSGIIKAVSYHDQPLYPLHDSFPGIDDKSYVLTGTHLANPVFLSSTGQMMSPVKPFGYADSRARGDAPYTFPDNPYTPEIENSGGDAFDISWAVNEAGAYVDLDEIDFVKVHTAVLSNASWLGEVSTEVRGAVDVSPGNATGNLDIVVIGGLPDTIRGTSYQLEVFAFHMGRMQSDAQISWESSLQNASVSDQHLLTFNASGELTLSASLASDASVKASVNVVLEFDPETGINPETYSNAIAVYPNPARDFISIKGITQGNVQIFDMRGARVLSVQDYAEGEKIGTGKLQTGIYILRVTNDLGFEPVKVIIQ